MTNKPNSERLISLVENYALAMRMAHRCGNKHGDMSMADNCIHEIKQLAKLLDQLPLEMLPGPNGSADKRRDNRDDELGC